MTARAKFGCLSQICVEDRATWKDRIFLTLDVDWAHDEVINDTACLIEKADVAATWFITHKTPIIDRLKENPAFELGIHPNFNFLLSGDDRNGANSAEVIDRLLSLVPDARSVRSHSMAQSSVLLDLFVERGLTHDSNHFVPHESGIQLAPWRIWNNLVKVPYFWEDDVHCLGNKSRVPADLAGIDGLKVFDFHPIHVFLNSDTLEIYEAARSHFAAPLELRKLQRPICGGTRELLTQLLGLA